MIAKAEVKFIRISPKKVRQIIDLIRDKDIFEAEAALLALNKRANPHLLKLLKQAIANAKTKGIDSNKLYISKIVCNNGPIWKRYKAAAFGRWAPIKRRTSHIRIELDIENNT